ncbi:monovalent cation/H+ antiporter complex subunit F [Cellulomonas alba]|uniref:Monovalent cation/H+ antiporter complex subunit F n=1 Tax=Cellulomonas alba TaxID=3053467 RepID=A0ABT7SF96_9CELL|nr:monovalent cation/H+ antiporter complex subunit F [Cellulomonas alba]MDM7854861.1 monovalent cation/H+ antiporter complex subunit F [Cellulomonas alba]
MIVVVLVCVVLLAVGAVCALVRAEKGPSVLDRTVALDVLVATMIAGLGVYAAWHRRVDVVPVLVVLSLVGFVGSVAIARFAAVEPEGEGRVRSRDEIAADAAAALGAASAWDDDSGDADEDDRPDTEHFGGGAEGEVR